MPMPRWPSRFSRNVERTTDGYGLVFFLLLGVFCLMALADGPWARFVIPPVVGGALLLTRHRSGVSWPHLRRLIGFTIVAVVVAMAASLINHSVSTPIVYWVVVALLVTTPVVILRRIFSHTVVDMDTMFGALSVYVIIGLTFTFVFLGVDAISNRPFLEPPSDEAAAYTYLSFESLTTIGFGNVVAATNFGQMLVILEALLGQAFLVTMVARLVSAWGSSPRIAPRRPDQPDR